VQHAKKIQKKLIFLELNEVNFDLAQEYVDGSPNHFEAIKSLFRGGKICTHSELVYEHLEPWIQWPSVHTGLSYEEHKICRLGDITLSNAPQIFEILEIKIFLSSIVLIRNMFLQIYKKKPLKLKSGFQ
jgi:acid stress-induced BolA-like protein IbaG/YrbA